MVTGEAITVAVGLVDSVGVCISSPPDKTWVELLPTPV